MFFITVLKAFDCTLVTSAVKKARIKHQNEDRMGFLSLPLQGTHFFNVYDHSNYGRIL